MTSSHNTWQIGELHWEATTNKVISPFHTWDHVTNEKIMYLHFFKVYGNQT